MKLYQENIGIPYANPFDHYRNHSNNGNGTSLLMESRSVNPKYGKQSIVVPNRSRRGDIERI